MGCLWKHLVFNSTVESQMIAQESLPLLYIALLISWLMVNALNVLDIKGHMEL